MHEPMKRVNKQNPCPICERPDWCLVAPDGSAAICQRIDQGAVKRCGDAGWLHILRDSHNRHNGHRKWNVQLDSTKPNKRFDELSKQYENQLKQEHLKRLSQSLHVSKESLLRLHVGWDGQSFTFPMSSDFGCVIGIQRRFLSGFKAMVKGSRLGLFIPLGQPEDGILLICEGASDTAAALDLRFAAVGRPSCRTGQDLVVSCARGRDVCVVPDNDQEGQAGAEELAGALLLVCPLVRVVPPPTDVKDLRRWLGGGLSREELLGRIAGAEPLQLPVSFQSRPEPGGDR